MKSEKSSQKERVALSSVLAGCVLTSGKAVVGLLTGSMGILSEALHSFLDLAAAVMTYFAVRYSDQPADREHPFGHGKIESVSALIETGLLFLTSVWIIYEAIIRLVTNKTEVQATWYAFAMVILSMLIDISRSHALYRVARETKSQALEADALHFSSDIYSSAAVLVGLIFVRLEWKGADAVAALAVAAFILLAGYRLGKRTIDVLVDKAPEGIADQARRVARTVPGVVNVGQIRVRPLGPNVFIEMSLWLNRQISLVRAHKILEQVERKIHKEMPEAELLLHPHSVQLNNESVNETIQALASKRGWSVHDVTVDQLDENKSISYHLELPDSFNLQKAHHEASQLEDEIRRELGKEIEIHSHLEPLKNDTILNSDIQAAELVEVINVLNEIEKTIPELSKIDNVQLRNAGKGLSVSFHCHADAELPIEQVHEITSLFEAEVKKRMKKIHRVIIHVEPK